MKDYWFGVIIGVIASGLLTWEITDKGFRPIEDAKCLENTIHIQAPDQRGLDVWTDTKVWCE
jgi:hypothetical protein